MSESEVLKVQRRGSRRSVIIVALILAIIILYLTLSGPVLLRVSTGPMTGDAGLTVFNPFRSRAPERCAESFLELMRTGRCDEAMAAISTAPEARETICENERQYPLASWRLGTREDESQKSVLSFWYRRDGYSAEDRLFVWLEKNGGQWQVINYRRAY